MIVQFFGDKGLTSTSANHVANMAKEYVESQRAILQTLGFVKTEVQAAGQTYITAEATSMETFNKIPEILDNIDKANRLIAWLREGLKAKKDWLFPDMTEWCVAHDIVYPEKPKREKTITEEEIISLWDVEKYNSYFAYQTRASVIGEAIHPGGQVAYARSFAEKVRNAPYEVKGTGRDLMVTKHHVMYDTAQIDDLFFKLQAEQREAQAKYNKLRHEIDSTIEKDEIEKNEAYEKAYEEYRQEISAILNQYQTWLTKEKKRIKDLKIIIPEAHQEIYAKIQSLGK